jgi:leucyl aminopeptidase
MRLMQHLFEQGPSEQSPSQQEQSSTPIVLMHTSDYPQWLERQEAACQAWLAANRFEAPGSMLLPDGNGALKQVLLVVKNLSDFFVAGDLALKLPAGNYQLDLTHCPALSDEQKRQVQQNFLTGWGLSLYRYDRYIKKGEDKKPQPVLLCADDTLRQQALHTIHAVTLVRDLVNAPANDMMPPHMSEEVDQIAQHFGAKTKHLIGDELLSANYPAIHAVGRASEHAPRLIELVWGDESAPKVTLVGKGVCFDSGGLDLKPASFMRTMKKDMGGAAQVLGLAWLIMAHQLPVRLRVLIPAVENAVSGNAFRPGDVLNTRAGLTVEIDNTDAEGRLVLCDALTEAVSEKPTLLIDFATLTGACRVALGTELPGFFSNDDELARSVMQAGKEASDPVWQLPLFEAYDDMLKSDIADLVNSSPSSYGGAITAALYLKRFVKDAPWLHFDVMAWNLRKLPCRPVGGEAMGVRAMFDYLQNRFK